MQQSKLNAFASLNWYDSFIEFLFRFVAKTSEPLLALGIVISAVDFLTKGALLTNDQSLTMAWAWTQAVAIEASSGVVFVYALQSFKGKDKVKGWLYLVLSVLLAVTGGAMLLLQLVANLTSVGESAMPGYLVIGLAVLRVIVSIGYVYMCRAKHIRFTDLEKVEQDFSTGKTDGTNTSISDETVQLILAKLAKLDQLEQTLSKPQVTVEASSEAPLALPSPSKVIDLNIGRVRMKRDLKSLIMVESITDEQPVPSVENVEKLSAPDFPSVFPDGTEVDEANLKAQIAKVLREQPDIKIRDLVTIVGGPQTTVYRHMVQVKKQMEKVEQNGKGE